ncbi:MAG: dockerin type I domain-containing protein, partial [Clostridiales bacterium]|nr:dockerin type I domain-containing protein [Clostridiales bacterium]
MLYIGNWLISGSVATPDRCQVRDGTIGIADMAFCDCTWVRSITIPASVIYIGTRAYGYETYSENGDVWKTTYIAHSSDTIYGYSDTAAETYADENELTFVDLNSISLLTSGDLNGDGEVDASDLTILARHVGKVETMEDETALANADV